MHDNTAPLVKRLLRAGSVGVVIKAFSMLMTIAIGVVLARILGPEGYGVYSFVIAIVAVLGIPVELGLPTLVVRETARLCVEERWDVIRGIWKWSGRMVMLLSSTIFLVVSPFFVVYADTYSEEKWATLIAGLLLVPIVGLAKVRSAALRGLRYVIVGQLPEQVAKPVVFLVLLGSFISLFSSQYITATVAMSMLVFASGISLFLSAYMLGNVGKQAADVRPAYDSQTWIRAVIPLAVISAVNLINKSTDTLLLGMYLSPYEVGIYSVAAQGALVVIFGLSVANLIVAPYFSRLYNIGDFGSLQRVVTLSSRCILLVALFVVAFYLLAGDVIVGAVFGREYLGAVPALKILAAGQLVNAAMGSVGFLLTMTGHEKEVVKAVSISAVVNIVCNMVFIPVWGVSGAAFATAISIVVWNTYLWFSVKKHLNIKSSPI